jgi:riboflavin synthase
MFTGLVQHVAKVHELEATDAGVRITLDATGFKHSPALGDSIAVSGCCLTVASIARGKKQYWSFNAIPETLRKTTLGSLKLGSRVNLEHALTPTTLMGGHFVQGHVDAVATVTNVLTKGEWRVTIEPPRELMDYMLPQGSITIDGVSLTIAGLTRTSVSVALIPTTLAKTTLADLRLGDRVNVEADVLAKAVVNTIKRLGAPHATRTRR